MSQPAEALEQRTFALLGGAKVLGRRPRTKLDAHELLSRGMPRSALLHLLRLSAHLRQEELAPAVGVSLRTLQRIVEDAEGRLSREQSGRLWKFAEVLAQATEVMGDGERAVQWLLSPALALDGRRPIDLLGTTVGTDLVEELLGRLEHGVYT